MKKFLGVAAMIMAVAMLSLALVPAFAESEAEEKKDENVLDSIGKFFTDTWDSTSKWVEGAWGDASKWVEDAWNDSAKWVEDIWGDFSTWATDNYNTAADAVVKWWNDTFAKVTTPGEYAWIEEAGAALRTRFSAQIDDLKTLLPKTDAETTEKIEKHLLGILKEQGLTEEEAAKVRDTINAYAASKDVDILTAQKLAIPYLMPVIEDNTEMIDNTRGVTIAQYLTAVFEKLGVNSQENAQKLLDELEVAVKDI